GTGGGWTAVDRSFSFSTATWYHVAVCRDGNNLRHFVDGTQVGSTADVTGVTFHNSTDLLTIGSYLNGAGSLANLNGQLAEVRISDTARYTTGFTVETERFTSDGNTLLLIHGDEYWTGNGLSGTTGSGATFTDSGNTGHTVTEVGNAISARGGTFNDSGNTTHVVTENGNAQRETEKEFKFDPDAVGYFMDGTGDYLSVPDHANWQLGGGTGEFTIECWVYMDNTLSQQFIFQNFEDGANRTHIRYAGTGTGWQFLAFSSDSVDVLLAQGSGTISSNTWTHIALTRDSSNRFDFWEDGVSVANTTDASTIADITGNMYIGYDEDNSQYFNGYIDEYRISDTCRYTTGFTPSTTQFTSDANTKLLIHCGETKSGTTGSGATFTDSGNTGHTVTENGNAIESTGNFYKF
ncbi:MAG: LamG domain-containing protein, partial [Anaerolineales bacterium]|nr:LamG domain-containing protein [Anaerolineales bacterium]